MMTRHDMTNKKANTNTNTLTMTNTFRLENNFKEVLISKYDKRKGNIWYIWSKWRDILNPRGWHQELHATQCFPPVGVLYNFFLIAVLFFCWSVATNEALAVSASGLHCIDVFYYFAAAAAASANPFSCSSDSDCNRRPATHSTTSPQCGEKPTRKIFLLR